MNGLFKITPKPANINSYQKDPKDSVFGYWLISFLQLTQCTNEQHCKKAEI